ncbi:MAG: hypothetical protein DI526_07025 [Caulobacter segnis]|uniref:Uncharacterized protein n=2 Tax=Caulobacter segnis TaxID=88688 RepID=A0A2W5VJJ6_9CAUL|nr:MAG: hypothetical protein DI526_07025 [Caulobacter segnis]
MDPRIGKLAWLTIACACGHRVHWSRAVILTRAGEWMRPAQLRAALRCTVCGARGKGVTVDGRRA